MLICLIARGHCFLNHPAKLSPFRAASSSFSRRVAQLTIGAASTSAAAAHTILSMSSSSTAAAPGSSTTLPSWSDLQNTAGDTAVGGALNREAQLRQRGQGSAHVQNKLRQFGSDETPAITLFRDHAGWCPYW